MEGLRNVRKAELLNDGIKLVGSFTLPEHVAEVNGVLMGVTSDGRTYGVEGMQGAPLGSCGLCGFYPLHNHYTLKNKKTGELINVGSECLADLFGSAKGEFIKKGIESIRRKVTADYKRPLHQKDLLDVLTDLVQVKGIVKIRNDRMDAELAKHPHQYISLNMDEFVPEAYKQSKGEPAYNQPNTWSVWGYCKDANIDYEDFKEMHFAEAWAKVEHEKNNDQQAIKLQEAKKTEQRLRNFWTYHMSVLPSKDWSPDTMKKEYIFEAKRDGIDLQIKWTPLTEAQEMELRKNIDTLLNDWISKITGSGAHGGQ